MRLVVFIRRISKWFFSLSKTTSLLQPHGPGGYFNLGQAVLRSTAYAYLVQGANVNEVSLRDTWKRTDIKALEFTDRARQSFSLHGRN